MAVINDPHSPSWVLFPVNTNCTGYRPPHVPVLLIVPHRRNTAGQFLDSSGVWNVRIYIEDVPQEALVAGHQHIGMRFPDRELYAENVGSVRLAERQLSHATLTILRDGIQILQSDAVAGDTLQYTTSTGVTDTVLYDQFTEYYDLSDIQLAVEQLPPGPYNLVFEATYHPRIISGDELLCVDVTIDAIAVMRFGINHPGDVLEEMRRLTPSPMLTDASPAADTTIALYRPFSDALQAVMDEQNLLERINWVFNIPAEAIPYLAVILGWELPYFPESLDQLRRAVLRRTVEFQEFKGSRRAIIELFRLFGFEIHISNLWWSTDGLRLIRPDQRLPAAYASQTIPIAEVIQTEILLNDWDTGGFGVFEIPLLYRPLEIVGQDDFLALQEGGNVSLDVYYVEKHSPAHIALQELAEAITTNPTGYGATAGCIVDSEGYLNPIEIHTRLAGLTTLGYSQVLISGSRGIATKSIATGPEIPLTTVGCSLNRDTNFLQLTLHGHMDGGTRTVYAFATYRRQELIVPAALTYLQSNRFDVQVLAQATAEVLDPVTLEFAIEFLHKAKAFHSILNAVHHRIRLTETYAVTDLCVGGNVQQRYDTDAGRLQVPPAIIPDIPGEANCISFDPIGLGYKPEDLIYRQHVLSGLLEEHTAWKALDGRPYTLSDILRIAITKPTPGRSACIYNAAGQDRTVGQRILTATVSSAPNLTANQATNANPYHGRITTATPVADGVGAVDGAVHRNAEDFGSTIREADTERSLATYNGIDVAIAIDLSGSMSAVLANFKTEILRYADRIVQISGGNYRFALVGFGIKIRVYTQFADGNLTSFQTGVASLKAGAVGGAGAPECSDEALRTILFQLQAGDRPAGLQIGDFTTGFRTDAAKIIILITDTVPAGFDDKYTAGMDDVQAHAIALQAVDLGVRISAVFSGNDPRARPIMRNYATVTGGTYLETATALDVVPTLTASASAIYANRDADLTDMSAWCTLDSVTDYCYKRRVHDELLYRPIMILPETVHTKACTLSVGYGVYWTYPAISVTAWGGVSRPTLRSRSGQRGFSGGQRLGGVYGHLQGIQKTYFTAPYDQRLPIAQRSYLGRLYRDYGVPSTTLHYSNRDSAAELQTRHIALQRPSLDIQQEHMHYPGCRFPRMSALTADWEHTSWRAKPWDDAVQTHCGPVGVCGNVIEIPLQAVIVLRDDGDTELRYTDIAYGCIGNGRTPDIISLGEHTLVDITEFAAIDVTHAVYMHALAAGHPAITMSGVCELDPTSGDDYLDTNAPLFTSAQECGSGLYRDYVDGYACVYGHFAYSIGDGDLDRGGLYTDFVLALGLEPGTSTELLFKAGSGIRVGMGIRLDCGCALVDCDDTGDASTICSASPFLDADGEYDWDLDQVRLSEIIHLEETWGVCQTRLTGEIPSMLEMLA